MSVVDAVMETPSVRGLAGSRWWLWLSLTAIVLLLAPPVAIGITNWDPDPVFMHFWWTPIAQAPTLALLIGSLGLDLLVATGIVAFVHRLDRKRRPVRPHVRSGAAIAIAVLIALAWSLAAAAQSGVSSSNVAQALNAGNTVTTQMSPQASKAVGQVLAWPTNPTSRVHILQSPSVPAGPWIVQTTEVLNENAQDEGADVVLETLFDPMNGHIIAAWYYGM